MKIWKFLWVMLLWGSITRSPVFGQEDLTKPIIKIDGKIIPYSEIRVADDKLSIIRKASGQIPDEDPVKDKEAAKQFRHVYEVRKLSKLIDNTLLPILYDEFKIEITESELKAGVEARVRQIDVNAAVEATRAIYSALLNALVDVYEKGKGKDAAFEEHLKDKYSKSQWESFLETYKSKESRQPLEAMTKLTPENFKKGFEIPVKQDLQERRLHKKIDDLISANDENFKKNLSAILNPESTAAEAQKDYVKKKRNEWWVSTYKKHVTVVDRSFADVFEVLLN